jgi:diguanylate cyclase (GGDEF)-like protein
VQWLAGGWATPYHQLFLALVVAAALIHTGRRAAVHTAWVVAMTLAPAAYGEVHGRIADVVVALGLWVFIAAFCSSVMVETRAQRATLLDNRDVAEDEARRDAVTGLENRRSFDETIEQALEHARDTGEALTLAVGDLDRFKAINDVHGHLAGDACLRAVADALSAAAREGDRVFRWGGDEFAVLIAGADRAAASAAAARLEAAVAASVRTPDGAPVTLTMGIAQDRGLRGADALVAEADEALLAGKRGRNLRAA